MGQDSFRVAARRPFRMETIREGVLVIGIHFLAVVGVVIDGFLGERQTSLAETAGSPQDSSLGGWVSAFGWALLIGPFSLC